MRKEKKNSADSTFLAVHVNCPPVLIDVFGPRVVVNINRAVYQVGISWFATCERSKKRKVNRDYRSSDHVSLVT